MPCLNWLIRLPILPEFVCLILHTIPSVFIGLYSFYSITQNRRVVNERQFAGPQEDAPARCRDRRYARESRYILRCATGLIHQKQPTGLYYYCGYNPRAHSRPPPESRCKLLPGSGDLKLSILR